MLLNVVMLSWEYPPRLVGGLSRHVFALARELADKGHRVHVLTRWSENLPQSSMEQDVHVLRVRPYFQEPRDFRLWVNHLNFALLEAGVKLLQGIHEPVVVHAHDWLVSFAAKGLKNLFHIPLVATIHATEDGRHGGIHNEGQQYINDVEWWLTYEAWRVIVCSEAMRAEVRRLFGLGHDKVAVVPNGIDLTEPLSAVQVPPRTAFAGPDERLLFHLGRLVPEKGAGILLEALSLVLQRHQVRLVIGGVGPFRDELERRTAELGLGARVHFTGWLDDAIAQALFRYADVTVVPSTYEPFGIVALEGMAAGSPLVVSDVGGLAEVITHGVNGLKALPGDARSLAQQIDRLLSSPGLARRLAGAGQRLAREKYSWAGVATATAALYQDVLTSCAHTAWGWLPSSKAVSAEPGPMLGQTT